MSVWLLIALAPVAFLVGYFVVGELVLGRWLGRQHFGRRHEEASR